MLNNVIENLLMNHTSQSLIMFEGNPKYFTTLQFNNPTTNLVIHTIEAITKITYLMNLSITTITVSMTSTFRNTTMKSIEIDT